VPALLGRAGRYQGLLQDLSSLRPPAVPPEFTSAVIATIELRERRATRSTAPCWPRCLRR